MAAVQYVLVTIVSVWIAIVRRPPGAREGFSELVADVTKLKSEVEQLGRRLKKDGGGPTKGRMLGGGSRWRASRITVRRAAHCL